jgi:ABC-type antimicrobial peptide transport system permease subunit
MLRDLRLAARRLVRSPGLTAIVVLTLMVSAALVLAALAAAAWPALRAARQSPLTALRAD